MDLSWMLGGGWDWSLLALALTSCEEPILKMWSKVWVCHIIGKFPDPEKTGKG